MFEENQKIKYFIYCRKSSEDEDRQILSIPAQIRELKEYAEKNDLEVAGLFQEERSAYKVGRPEFSKMMEQISMGLANGLIVWNANRISRNTKDGGAVIYAMDTGEIVEIRTPSRTYKNTPEDKFFLQIEFGVAKKSSDDNSRDTARGLRQKIENKQPPMKAPIGYLNIDKDGKIVGRQYDLQKQILLEQGGRELNKSSWEIDPILAPLVKKIFIEADNGCYNIEQIFKMSREQGLKIKRSQVYRLLQNPAYCGGIFLYKGKLQEGNHEGIISKELWDRVQIKLNGHAKPRKQIWKWAYAGGLVKCGECGYSIVFYTKVKPSGKKYTYVSCSKRGGECNQKTLSMSEFEKQLNGLVSDIYIDERVLNLSFKLLKLRYGQQIETQNEMRKKWQKETIIIEQKLKRLLDLRLDGEIDEEQFSAKKSELIALKRDYNEKLKDADGNTEGYLDRAEEFFKTANIAKEILQNGTIEQKRRLVGSIGWNFQLKDEKLAWEYRKPFDQLVKSKKTAIQTGEWLELMRTGSNKEKVEVFASTFPVWGARWDLNPWSFGPQPNALTAKLRAPSAKL